MDMSRFKSAGKNKRGSSIPSSAVPVKGRVTGSKSVADSCADALDGIEGAQKSQRNAFIKAGQHAFELTACFTKQGREGNSVINEFVTIESTAHAEGEPTSMVYNLTKMAASPDKKQLRMADMKNLYSALTGWPEECFFKCTMRWIFKHGNQLVGRFVECSATTLESGFVPTTWSTPEGQEDLEMPADLEAQIMEAMEAAGQ